MPFFRILCIARLCITQNMENKDKMIIRFINDADRKEAFDILGKDEIKRFTKWKGPSIWA